MLYSDTVSARTKLVLKYYEFVDYKADWGAQGAMDVRRPSEERRIPCFAQRKSEAVSDDVGQRGVQVWAHFCVDDHATTAEGIGDGLRQQYRDRTWNFIVFFGTKKRGKDK